LKAGDNVSFTGVERPIIPAYSECSCRKKQSILPTERGGGSLCGVGRDDASWDGRTRPSTLRPSVPLAAEEVAGRFAEAAASRLRDGAGRSLARLRLQLRAALPAHLRVGAFQQKTQLNKLDGKRNDQPRAGRVASDAVPWVLAGVGGASRSLWCDLGQVALPRGPAPLSRSCWALETAILFRRLHGAS